MSRAASLNGILAIYRQFDPVEKAFRQRGVA